MAGIKRNLAANLYATLAVTAGQVALVPLFLRWWGPEYYGQWLVLSAVPAYLAFSDIGISNALGNEFSIAVERGENGRAQNLLGAVWRYQGLFFLVLTLLVGAALLVLPLQAWLRTKAIGSGEFTAVFLLLTAYSLLPLQIGSFSGVYRAARAFPQYLILQGHLRMLDVLGTAVLLWFQATMVWLALWLVVLRISALFFMAVQARRLVPALTLHWRQGTWSDFKSLLPSGAGFFAFPVGNALINQSVTLVVNSTGGAAAVVTLSICRQVGRIFLQVSSMLFTSLHPEITTAYAKLDRTRMKQMQSGAFSLALILGIVFAAGCFGVGSWVVEVWTGTTAVSGILIGIFALEAVTASLANLALVVPWAASRLGSLPVTYLVVQALSLAATWVAFPSLGLIAVAIAFVLGNLLFMGLAINRSLAELDCRLPDFLRSGWSGLRASGGIFHPQFS